MSAVVIVGCGYVGAELARRLVADGREVIGVRRDARRLDGVHMIAADARDRSALERAIPEHAAAIVYAIGATERSPDAYREAYVESLERTIDVAARRGRPRLVLASSTAVYEIDDGSWVDESTPAEPSTETGRALRDGERLALGCGLPATVLRFGGIYGPGRDRLVREVAHGTARIPATDRYTNRIHRHDCAGAIRHVLAAGSIAPLLIAVDREPATYGDVLRFIADRIGSPAPPRASEPTRSERGGNKRCSSDALARTGYRFEHPTYREGYAALCDAFSREERRP